MFNTFGTSTKCVVFPWVQKAIMNAFSYSISHFQRFLLCHCKFCIRILVKFISYWKVNIILGYSQYNMDVFIDDFIKGGLYNKSFNYLWTFGNWKVVFVVFLTNMLRFEVGTYSRCVIYFIFKDILLPELIFWSIVLSPLLLVFSFFLFSFFCEGGLFIRAKQIKILKTQYWQSIDCQEFWKMFHVVFVRHCQINKKKINVTSKKIILYFCKRI